MRNDLLHEVAEPFWLKSFLFKTVLLARGRLTALRKPDGGVTGIMVGDVVRRLVSRTVTQQLGEAVKLATSPFQYALSTRAVCECIAHALQALTEANPEATILSVDGIGAFDLVSRGAMLQGLCDVSPSAVTFVRQFYGTPSDAHALLLGSAQRTEGCPSQVAGR